MPANLPPQYYEVERKFRAAKNPMEKLAILEEMMAIMPKHKGTDHLRAELRGRMAKLQQMASKKTGAQRASMAVEKEGASQIAVVGLPNSGKSQLLTAVTKAATTVAEYPFTTQTPIPGMMPYEDIQFQLIDTPPLVPQGIAWWLPSILRQAEGLLLIVDLSENPLEQMESIRQQLAGMRIYIGKEASAGREEEEPITWPKKVVLAGNKADLDTDGSNFEALKEIYGGEFPVIAISAAAGRGLEDMKRLLYKTLDLIRVYTKAPGKKADMTDPIILKRGSTLGDAATSVHKDFAQNLRFARIWGSGKHDGVMAGKDHVLADGDVVELHLKD
jgi:ribosome-interacting GTPase 1